MSAATQPDIRITSCGDSEFYRIYTPPMQGFGFSLEEKRSSALSRYFLARQGDDLTGFVKFMPSDEFSSIYLSYIEVRQDRQNMGVSKRLLSALFEEASRRKMDLALSQYTDIGRTRLLRQIERLQKRYGDITLSYEQSC